MKKLGLMIGAGVLLIVMAVAGAGLWIKGHMQEVARKMTGLDIHFATLDVRYAPMPLIVMTDLALNHGPNSVRIPRLELYPDLGRVFSGQISVKRAVLEDPVVVARDLGGRNTPAPAAEPSGSPAFSMSAMPDGVAVVHRGQIVLQSAQGQRLPVSLTAQAEKVGQHLSIQLKRASVDEIGLTFAGEVAVESFAPLKLKISAADGSFNPRALKDFLLKFGYLNNDAADRVPAVERMQAQGLTVGFDAAAGDIDLTAQSLEVDRVLLHQVAVKLSGGRFELACADGEVDAGTIYSWLQQNPDARKVLEEMLTRSGLKSLSPQGVVRIAGLHLHGGPLEREGAAALGPIDGAVDLAVQNLILQLTAQNGQEQRLTVSQLESRVTIEQGKPSVQVKQLTFDSSRGGSGRITGFIPLPPDLKRTILKSAIEGLKVFDTTLDFHLDKAVQAQTTFDLALNAPSLKVSADGLLFIPGRRQTDLEARLAHLRIAGSGSARPARTSTAPSALSQPFDAGLIVDKPISAQAFVKSFQLGESTRLQDVDLRLESANKRAVLHGTVRLCDVNLSLDAVVLPPSRVVTTVETKGTDVDLTSLVACFSKELPVYLAGRLYVSGNFAADGNTPQALIDGAQGEVTVLVTQASVQRLSGLDARLGFFLDILRSARISSEKEDAISLSRGVVKANLQKGQLVVDRFQMIGPLLSAWGSGQFTLKDKHLKLSGGVKTALGVTSGLDIDRILEKEGT